MAKDLDKYEKVEVVTETAKIKTGKDVIAEVDLVAVERHAAIQIRSSSSDPAVTVIEFGPRIRRGGRRTRKPRKGIKP